MQMTSAIWKALWASGSAWMEARAVVGGVTYADMPEPPVISRAAMHDALSVGNVVSASLLLSIRPTAAIARSAPVAVSVRLNDGADTSEWVPQGTFYISKRAKDPVTGVLRLECYDALLKSNAVWEPTSGSWPRSMATVLTELLTLLGVSLDLRSVIPSGVEDVISEPAAGTTIRDALSLIAQAGCGNWVITPWNELRLVPLLDAADAADAAANALDVVGVVGGIDVEGAAAITGIRNTWDELVTLSGDDTGIVIDTQVIPLIAAGIEAALVGLTHQPFRLDGAIYDPAAEIGDYVRAGVNGEVASVLYTESIALGPGPRGDISAPSSGELTDEYPYIGATERAIALAKAYANAAVESLDDELTQQEIFDRLTDNGAAQGLVLYNGQLYINASYIKAGILTLGGANNVNGEMQILDAGGNVVGTWDKDGITATAGSIGDWSILNGGLQYSKALSGAISVLMSVGQAGLIYRWLNSTLSQSHSTVVDENITMDFNGKAMRLAVALNADGNVVELKVQTATDGETFTDAMVVGETYIKLLNALTLSTPLGIASGGTGATDAEAARRSIGISAHLYETTASALYTRIKDTLKIKDNEGGVNVYCNAATVYALTGGKINERLCGVMTREDITPDTTLSLNILGTIAYNATKLVSFNVRITSTTITPTTVYQYSGTAL